MTDEIQQTRYDQLMRRVAGIIGPGSKVGTVVSELFPMIDVERVPGELLFLMGTRMGFSAASLTAAAGQTSKLQLFNPDESGKLITVTSMWIGSDATQILTFGLESAARGAAIGPGEFRDTRGSPGEPTSAVVNFELSAPTVTGTARIPVIANESTKIDDENGVAVLQPGTGLTVSPLVQVTRIDVTFFWRERVAEKSELNL